MARRSSLKSLLPMKAIAIHEASGQDITYSEVAFSLVVGGGKPGQGYPCVLVEVEDDPVYETRIRVTAMGDGDFCDS